MKRMLVVLTAACLLAACAPRGPLTPSSSAVSSVAPVLPQSSASAAPASSEEPSSLAPQLPELEGTFVAGWSDEFDQPQLAIGQEADKARFDALLSHLREETKTVRYWTNQAVLTQDAPLTDECEDLIALLAAAPYRTGGAALENPPTGGGWTAACYNAAGEKRLLATFNGAWLVLSGSDGRSYVFDGTDCGLEAGQLDANDYVSNKTAG